MKFSARKRRLVSVLTASLLGFGLLSATTPAFAGDGTSAPVANDDNVSIDAGSQVTYNVLSNDTYTSGDKIIVTGPDGDTPVSSKYNGLAVRLSASSGSLIVTTDASAVAQTQTFQYILTDTTTGLESAPATITVVVSAPPPPPPDATAPVASDDNEVVGAGETAKYNVLSNDTYTSGDTITTTGTDGETIASKSNGLLVRMDTDGYLAFTTTDDIVDQTQTFQYVVHDTTTGLQSAPATITIVVHGKSGIVAKDKSFGPVYANVVDFNVLASDSDLLSDRKLTIVSSSSKTDQTLGGVQPTVSLVGGTTFHLGGVVPQPGGTLTFHYVVSDGVDTATVKVTVVYKSIGLPVVKVLHKAKPTKKVKRKVKKHGKTKTKIVKKAYPASIRFTNPNSAPILVTYWSDAKPSHHVQVQVPAGRSVTVSVAYTKKHRVLHEQASLLTPTPLAYSTGSGVATSY